MDQVDYRPVNLAFLDYAQKDFDTPPARWRGFRRITGGADRSASTLGDADAFANAGIEGLFANIGFNGLRDLRFASWPVVEWVASVGSVPLGRGGVKCWYEEPS
jgi:hypothetical protein